MTRQAAWLLRGDEVVEGGGERKTFLLLERDRDAVGVARQRDQHLAMPRGDLGEIVGARRRQAFQRRERRLQRRDQRLRAIELPVLQARPRFRSMQRGDVLAAQLFQFAAEAREILGEALGSGLRARSAQQRQLERFDGAGMLTNRAAEPAQRMFQQRKQCRRLQLFRDRVGGEPRKSAGGVSISASPPESS